MAKMDAVCELSVIAAPTSRRLLLLSPLLLSPLLLLLLTPVIDRLLLPAMWDIDGISISMLIIVWEGILFEVDDADTYADFDGNTDDDADIRSDLEDDIDDISAGTSADFDINSDVEDADVKTEDKADALLLFAEVKPLESS